MDAANTAAQEISPPPVTVIVNDGPIAPSGVTVMPKYRNAYAGEPDGVAYVPSADGTKVYRVEMRPTGAPFSTILRS